MVIILSYLVISFLLIYGNKKYPKINIAIIFILGVLINGFRSVTFTGDNIVYVQYFVNNSKLSLAESWSRVLSQYDKDPFYYFLGNVFSKLGFTYRGWFVFIAIVYLGGFFYIVSKYSRDYFVSLLFLISQSYFYFSMTGLRQTLAMGVCFFAFDYAMRKKLVPFLLLVFLAAMFHSSAWVFIVFYPLKNMKFGWRQVGAILIAVMMSIFFSGSINRFISLLAWSDTLAGYSEVTTGLSISGFVIQLFIILLYIYSIGMQEINEISYRPYINILFLGLFFQTFVINIDNIFRMSMYFSVYGALTIPEAIVLQPDKRRMIVYAVVVIALLLWLLRSGRFDNLTLFGGL